MDSRNWTNYFEVVLILFCMRFVCGTKDNFACDVNLCDADVEEFECQTGSIILIEEVMCRRGGDNCDQLAFHEVTRMCSGRQRCHPADLWKIRGQFCLEDEVNDQGQSVMSLVFASYICISSKALESNCSRRGVAVSADQRYVSSPGYPALVIGSSVCTWRIHPPNGYDVDIYVREYLHLDQSDKLFVRVRELLKNRVGMKLERTSDRGLQFTMQGDVEILMFTHGALGGHRVWIEYRFVRDSSLEHLRPFSMPNRTDCGGIRFNITSKTNKPSVSTKEEFSSFQTTNISLSTSTSLALNRTMVSMTTTHPITTVSVANTSLVIPGTHSSIEPPDSNHTIIQEQHQYEVASDMPIIIASSIVGVVFTATAIFIAVKCRKRKKPGQHRNCLGTDTVSVASDRALLACTPTQGRCHFVLNSATLNVPDSSAGTGNSIMLGEEMETKSQPSSLRDKEISVIDQHSYQQGFDFNPIDFTKYIINNQQTNNDRIYNEEGV